MVSQFLKLKKCLLANRSFAELPRVEQRIRMFIPLSDKRMPGRYLIVFHIQKGEGMVLPISARDMNPAERKYYEKHR